MAKGVPKGLDPRGVKIALQGGKHWGASDQRRYDEWARKNGKSSGNAPSSPKSSSGVPKGLDPQGVKIAMGGGKHWGATDQRRYDEWAKRNNKSSSSSSSRTPSAAPRPAPKSSAKPASSSRSVSSSGGAEKGMFGLEGIMKNFYDYKPSSDDEYGNYVKNTFASNMIQSAFDTQNAKDLAYAQGEIASAQMTQAADLQRLNTQAIMRKEYQYGTDMMKQQFQYQSQFADDQHSRDLGMMSAMGKEERQTAAQQQASDQKIAFGRYDADKYISDNTLAGTKYTSDNTLAGTKYTADQNLAGIKDTNKTSTENIRVTGDETRKTANNQQRLSSKERAEMHGYARRTARDF